MIKKTRLLISPLAILLASTTVLVAMSGFAAARGGGSGHATMHNQSATPSRDVKSKPTAYRKNGSRPIDARVHKKHKGCGKLILPTAGCATPARDPVGNTRPSLPQEAKQPTNSGRQPVREAF